MESIYTNCETLVKSYLLYQNPLYVYSFPIALIVAIVMYGICSTMKWCQNSYVAQIIVPIFTIFVVIWIIDAVAKSMIDAKEVDMMMGVCTEVMAKVRGAREEHFTEAEKKESGPTPTPSPNAPAQMAPNVAVALNYQDKLEDEGQLRSPLSQIDALYKSTVTVINPDTAAYHLPYNGLNTPGSCDIR